MDRAKPPQTKHRAHSQAEGSGGHSAIPASQDSNAGSTKWMNSNRTAATLKILRNTIWVGIAVSVLVHVFMLIIAANIWFDREVASIGPGGVADPVEFAIVTERELAELQSQSLESTTPIIEPAESIETFEPEIIIESFSELDSIAIDLPESMSLSGGDPSDQSGDSGSEGFGQSMSGEGGGTKFFGVEALGSRFAFVVDWSGSMAHGGKVDALKRELIAAINELPENGAFFVVFYASDAFSLGNRTDWVDATDKGKKWARTAITRMDVPRGGTEPIPGFAALTRLRPRPDAIYFMTDGEFPADYAIDILQIQRKLSAPIHAITFVNPGAAVIMKTIASQSGGSYTHVGGP